MTNVTRRTFLKLSAGVAAVITTSPLLLPGLAEDAQWLLPPQNRDDVLYRFFLSADKPARFSLERPDGTVIISHGLSPLSSYEWVAAPGMEIRGPVSMRVESPSDNAVRPALYFERPDGSHYLRVGSEIHEMDLAA